jgi:hypothetical protein
MDVDNQVLALRRLAKVPLAELSEAMVNRALLMAADKIEKLGAEAAAAAWKEEQERRRASLSEQWMVVRLDFGFFLGFGTLTGGGASSI